MAGSVSAINVPMIAATASISTTVKAIRLWVRMGRLNEGSLLPEHRRTDCCPIPPSTAAQLVWKFRTRLAKRLPSGRTLSVRASGLRPDEYGAQTLLAGVIHKPAIGNYAWAYSELLVERNPVSTRQVLKDK